MSNWTAKKNIEKLKIYLALQEAKKEKEAKGKKK